MNRIVCEWSVWSKYRERLSFSYRQLLRWRLLHFESTLPKAKFIFLVTGSFGDLIPTFLLIKEFCEVHSTEAVVVTYSDMLSFTRRFKSQRIDFRFITRARGNSLHKLLIVSGRNFFLEPGFIFPTLPTIHPYIAEAILTQRLSEYEGRRLIFGLPVGHKIEFIWDSDAEKSLLLRLKNRKIFKPQDCLIISPLSNTNPSLSPLFSKLIINELSSHYKVIVNLAGASPEVERTYTEVLESLQNTIFFNLNPEEVFEATRLVKAHIGTINGLSTMLLFFNGCARNVVIREKFLRNPSVSPPLKLSSIKDTLQKDWNINTYLLEITVNSTETHSHDLSPIIEAIYKFISREPLGLHETMDSCQKDIVDFC